MPINPFLITMHAFGEEGTTSICHTSLFILGLSIRSEDGWATLRMSSQPTKGGWAPGCQRMKQ